MAAKQRSKAPGVNAEEARPRPVPGSEKPKAAEAGGAWGKAAPAAPRPAAAPSSSSSSSVAKAKAQAKASINIAAMAARNLGGFVPNKVFVGGVPMGCTDEQFRGYFESFGVIKHVELHALRGFGYITYEQVESVDNCLEKYEEHYLCKKWVEVKRSIPRELIEAYEREQRRLTAEHEAKENGGAAPAVAVPVAAPTAPTRKLVEPANHVGPRPGAPAAGGWGAKGGGKGESSGTLSRISQLKEMGFSEQVARRVLAECAWDVNKAIDHLLTAGPPSDGGGVPPSVGGNDFPALGGAGVSGAPPPGPAPPSPDANPWDGRAAPGSPAGRQRDPSGWGSRGAQSPHIEEPEAFESDAQAPVWSGRPHIEEPVEAEVEAPGVASFNAAGLDAQTHVAPVHEHLEPDAEPNGAAVAAATVVQQAETTDTQPAPAKRIQRAKQVWVPQEGHLGVQAGDFVEVWLNTLTEHGWIYAEAQQRVGWLPEFVCEEQQEGRRWMRTIQPWVASDASHSSVEAGDYVLVLVGSRTPEGWAYVEAADGSQATAGWLPVHCIEWNDK